MKRSLLAMGVISGLLLIFAVKNSRAEDFPSIVEEEIWQLTVQATGQRYEDGLPDIPSNVSKRYIGMDTNAVVSEILDQPPPYSTAYIIVNGNLYRDIRKIGSDREVWMLTVKIGSYADPNLEHYYPELSWDPNKIGPATLMELRRGHGEAGEILVADMTDANSYLTQEADGTCIPSEGCWLTYSIIFDAAYHMYYLDSDNDNYGDPNKSVREATQPLGYVLETGDCDDTDPNSYPGAPELCDGKDNNCDGFTPQEELTDGDSDGIIACADCYDDDPNSYPGAPEICDGKDNDCDNFIDEGLGKKAYYFDNDNDGYGDPDLNLVVYDCKKPEGNYVLKGNDCDDNNPSANPGDLGIENMEGETIPDFELGRNHVTLSPSCPQYDSYALLQDSKVDNKLLNIHHSVQDTESIEPVIPQITRPSTYWFFGLPCGKNFIIQDETPYWVFRRE